MSGTGVVAEGVEFSTGTVVLTWLGEWSSTVVHRDMASVEHIHGHGGATRIVWLDWPDDTQPDSLFRCWDFQYCLGGETSVITRNGHEPIRDIVGDLELLTAGNRGVYWVRDGAHLNLPSSAH